MGRNEGWPADASERGRDQSFRVVPEGGTVPQASGGAALAGSRLTVAQIHALAAVDLLPVVLCVSHEWMIADWQILTDGVFIRCPAEGCGRRFGYDGVTFMDDTARRQHGLRLETVD